uniref:F-box domain-containing protein n=1 Tax=Zea mays TaxID=4577 RepID=B8A032_MAIZE|nr:unknown [Zea mays]
MGECEDGKEYRCWEELLPDALGLIFRNLPLQEVLTVLPRVCKSWGRVVAGPYCWQEIDIEEWSQQQSKPEQIGRMVELLVGRSGGSCRRISVSGLPCDPLFSFIADNARALGTLEIPRSEISDSVVEAVAPRLSNVTFLDISSCTKIGARALEAFGRHCRSLVGLRRVMHPIDLADKVCQHDEAHAIARSMPRLRHLEMGYMLVATEAVLEILEQCSELKFLDLRGCWAVERPVPAGAPPGAARPGPARRRRLLREQLLGGVLRLLLGRGRGLRRRRRLVGVVRGRRRRLLLRRRQRRRRGYLGRRAGPGEPRGEVLRRWRLRRELRRLRLAAVAVTRGPREPPLRLRCADRFRLLLIYRVRA